MGAGLLSKGKGERVLHRVAPNVAEDVEEPVVLYLRRLGLLVWEDCQQTRAYPVSVHRLGEVQSHLKEGGRGDRVGENSGLSEETGGEEHSDANASSGVWASASGMCAEECNFGSRRVAEGGKVDEKKRQQKLREKKEREKALRAKKEKEKLAKGLANTSEEAEGRALEKRWRDGDEGLSELDKRHMGLETVIHDVMGRIELPPCDLDPSPKLPLGLDELFPEGPEDIDFTVVRRQKSVLFVANALARAQREVALARRHSESAKAATTEAQAYIREKNALQLKVGRLERELKKVSRRLEAAEEARVEAERKKAEELAAACAQAVEKYKVSDE